MTAKLESTVTREQASGRSWDVIVVGAGIAGSLASLGLARLGRKVLLIERASLPRTKVCGACLNENAIGGLREAGVWERINALGGYSLNHYCLRAGTSRANLDLSGGHAVSRLGMDRVLTESAIEAGAELLSSTAVTVEAGNGDAGNGDAGNGEAGNGDAGNGDNDGRSAGSSSPGYRSVLDNHGNRYAAKTVVVANGLGGRSLGDDEDGKMVVSADSRIGLGAQWVPDEQASNSLIRLSEGVIYMAVGQSGYVGLVVTEGGTINLAAAVDRQAVQAKGPANVCQEVLRSCGWDLGSDLTAASFQGTRTLTRRRAVAGGHRLFFAGDSSGYVEPFTGEGMAWAVRAGMAVVPWVDDSVRQWRDDFPQQWTAELKRLLGNQQWRCRLLSRALRHPALVRQTVKTLARFPALGRFAVERFQRDQASIGSDPTIRRQGAWATHDAA